MITREDIDDAINQFIDSTDENPEYACDIANALISVFYGYLYENEPYERNYQPPKLVVNKAKE